MSVRIFSVGRILDVKHHLIMSCIAIVNLKCAQKKLSTCSFWFCLMQYRTHTSHVNCATDGAVNTRNLPLKVSFQCVSIWWWITQLTQKWSFNQSMPCDQNINSRWTTAFYAIRGWYTIKRISIDPRNLSNMQN